MSKPRKVQSSQTETGADKGEKPEFGQRRSVLCASVMGAVGLGVLALFGASCRQSHDVPKRQDVAAAVSPDAPAAADIAPHKTLDKPQGSEIAAAVSPDTSAEATFSYKTLDDVPGISKMFQNPLWPAMEDSTEWEKLRGTPLVLDLIARLSSTNIQTRRAAAIVLGFTKDPRAVEPLIDRLSEPDRVMRHSVVVALGMLGDPRAIQSLLERLSDRDMDVRKAVIRALTVFLNYEGVLQAITDTFSDRNAEVREQVALSLGEMKVSRAVQSLIGRLSDPDYCVRIAAIDALWMIGDSTALPALEKRLSDRNREVRERAEHVIARFSAGPDEGEIYASICDRSHHAHHHTGYVTPMAYHATEITYPSSVPPLTP